MPLQRCTQDGKSGWRWGSKGKCYIYTPGSKQSETVARKKAENQGLATGEFFRDAVDRLNAAWKKLRSKKK